MLKVVYAPHKYRNLIPDAHISFEVDKFLCGLWESKVFYCNNSIVVDCFRAMLLTDHKHLISQVEFYYLDADGNQKLIPFDQSMRSDWYPDEYNYTHDFSTNTKIFNFLDLFTYETCECYSEREVVRFCRVVISSKSKKQFAYAELDNNKRLVFFDSFGKSEAYVQLHDVSYSHDYTDLLIS